MHTQTSHSVLILYAHPRQHLSRINAALRAQVENLDNVTLCDLYEQYPDFLINIPREQALLREHDIIVLQHPIYWYSAPALVKEWLDVVLEYGFAYGQNATALHGKYLLQAVSSGGRDYAFQSTGSSRYSLVELLRPFEQTAHLCGMHYLPPFWVAGAHYLSAEAIAAQAERYREHICALRDGTIPAPLCPAS